MEHKLLIKMINNCFLQYSHDIDSLGLSPTELLELCKKIINEKENNPDIEIYELVNDIVYEYLTK